jgi:hypothetical protein
MTVTGTIDLSAGLTSVISSLALLLSAVMPRIDGVGNSAFFWACGEPTKALDDDFAHCLPDEGNSKATIANAISCVLFSCCKLAMGSHQDPSAADSFTPTALSTQRELRSRPTAERMPLSYAPVSTQILLLDMKTSGPQTEWPCTTTAP